MVQRVTECKYVSAGQCFIVRRKIHEYVRASASKDSNKSDINNIFD